MRSNSEEHDVEKLEQAECIILTLSELSGKFRFADSSKFRSAILARGILPYQRLSRERFRVRVCDLPGKEFTI